LYQTLEAETKSWGVEIVRTELKEIDPPKDVQETKCTASEKIAGNGNRDQK